MAFDRQRCRGGRDCRRRSETRLRLAVADREGNFHSPEDPQREEREEDFTHSAPGLATVVAVAATGASGEDRHATPPPPH